MWQRSALEIIIMTAPESGLFVFVVKFITFSEFQSKQFQFNTLLHDNYDLINLRVVHRIKLFIQNVSSNARQVQRSRVVQCIIHTREWYAINQPHRMMSMSTHRLQCCKRYNVFYVQIKNWNERKWQEKKWSKLSTAHSLTGSFRRVWFLYAVAKK